MGSSRRVGGFEPTYVRSQVGTWHKVAEFVDGYWRVQCGVTVRARASSFDLASSRNTHDAVCRRCPWHEEEDGFE
jgi:hypothetical protein